MKKLALLALLLLVTLAASAAELPDTPAAKTFARWIESYNAHDLDARKAWLKENSSLTQEQIDRYAPMDIAQRDSEGKLELVSVDTTEAKKISVVVRHLTTGTELTVGVEVDDKGKIVRMSIRPA